MLIVELIFQLKTSLFNEKFRLNGALNGEIDFNINVNIMEMSFSLVFKHKT
jgi:hypothetical protein